MRLGGRLAAAIEVLETLESQRRPVTQVLKDWGHAHRFAGSGDRAAIANLVHDALRHRRSLAARMGDDSARAAILATYCLVPGYGDGTLPDLSGDTFAPPPLSDEEASALSAAQEGVAPADAANCPDWLWGPMERVFGGDAQAQVGAMAARAPLDLRVNPFRSQPARVDKALSRFKPSSLDAFPQLRRIAATQGFERAPHIASGEAFQKGWIEVQDAGSQLAADLALAGLKPRTVLDYCAGAGGKTLALSVAMGGKGQVFAHDADERRMGDLWPRVKRAGAHNIQVIAPDALPSHEQASQGFDLVVVDAPCTGTGTWRRHPDTKWRLAPSALERRMEEQRSILEDAAKLVKPGGRLCYITCSLLAEENEDQLAGLLKDHADFAAMSSATLMQALNREALPGYLPSIAVDGHADGDLGVRLTPQTSSTDGFFIACLTRSASA